MSQTQKNHSLAWRGHIPFFIKIYPANCTAAKLADKPPRANLRSVRKNEWLSSRQRFGRRCYRPSLSPSLVKQPTRESDTAEIHQSESTQCCAARLCKGSVELNRRSVQETRCCDPHQVRHKQRTGNFGHAPQTCDEQQYRCPQEIQLRHGPVRSMLVEVQPAPKNVQQAVQCK